jgi:hypothetical protein
VIGLEISPKVGKVRKSERSCNRRFCKNNLSYKED